MENKGVLWVSEFNELINGYLSIMGEVYVKGEISQLRVSQNKWIFLIIKDNTSSVEVFGTIYSIHNHRELEEGMLVQVTGTPRLYQKSGRFSIFADQISPAGLGALQIAFEKLKLRLEKEGIFDVSRKRSLPEFPEKIGLITALGSRAYSDFIKVLSERIGGIKIYFYPVQVQGESSVKSIVRAITYFGQNMPDLDLLVITRGGGSLEDLVSFNDEKVVRAIFTSQIPVVCAVGHEEDVSLSDLVADLRASTPSNSAELIVRQRSELLIQINNQIRLIKLVLTNKMNEAENQVFKSISQLKSHLDSQLYGIQQTITSFHNKFINYTYSVGLTKEKLTNLTRLLQSLDYRKLLAKGYSITYNRHGKVINSVKQIKSQEEIQTQLLDGKILSLVK